MPCVILKFSVSMFLTLFFDIEFFYRLFMTLINLMLMGISCRNRSWSIFQTNTYKEKSCQFHLHFQLYFYVNDSNLFYCSVIMWNTTHIAQSIRSFHNKYPIFCKSLIFSNFLHVSLRFIHVGLDPFKIVCHNVFLRHPQTQLPCKFNSRSILVISLTGLLRTDPNHPHGIYSWYVNIELVLYCSFS